MSRDADNQNQDAKGARRGKRRPKEVVEKVLTEEEQQFKDSLPRQIRIQTPN